MTSCDEQARGDVPHVNWKAVHKADTAHDFFEGYHGQFYKHKGFYLESTSPQPEDQANVRVPLLNMQTESDFIVQHEASAIACIRVCCMVL